MLDQSTFDTRFFAAIAGIMAGNAFNLVLMYAQIGEDKPQWFVVVGGEAGSIFTPKETRRIAKKLVKHAKRQGWGLEPAREWSKDLNEVAAECDERNAHGVLPEHIQRPN